MFLQDLFSIIFSNSFLKEVFPETNNLMEVVMLCYINFQIFLFISCSLWYLTPLLCRWVCLSSNKKFLFRLLKKNLQLKQSRETIEAKIFKRSSWAFDGFKQFRIAWYEARLRGEDNAAIPIRLRDFLSRASVVERAANQKISEALPGIFVALGILGTFLGLYYGLSNLKIDQLDFLQKGVGQLIGGLSVAFKTSLVGIVTSVLFTWGHRFLVRRMEKNFLSIDDLLVQVYPFTPSEQYTRRYLEVQEDIKAGFQTLATDIATKLTTVFEPAFDRAVSKNLVPLIENLGQIMREHLDKTGEKQSTALEKVLRDFVEYMKQTFQGQFSDLNQIIADTTAAQKEIRDQMIVFVEKLGTQFEAQTALIEQTGRASQILNSSLESLERISQGLTGAAGNIATAATQLETSAQKAMEGQESLRQTMERQIQGMVTTREELEKTWGIITGNMHSVANFMRQTIQEFSQGVGEHLTRALEVFDGKVAEITERFSGTLFETKETISELPEFFIRLDTIFENLEKDIAEQRNAVIELKEVTLQLVKPNFETLADVTGSLKDSFGVFRDLSGQISANIESTGRFFSEQGPVQSAFASVHAEIKKLHDGMSEQGHTTAQALALVTETYRTLRQDVSEASGGNDGSHKKLINYIEKAYENNLNLFTKVENMTLEIGRFIGQIKDNATGQNGNNKELYQRIDSLMKSNEKLFCQMGSIANMFSRLEETEPKGGFFSRMIRR